jgi:hypothetical protein
MSLAGAARSVAASLAFPLALSCGAAAPAPQAPAAPALAAAALPATVSPDLGAVPDPPSLVVSGRIAKPSASLSIVHEWTKLAMPQSVEVTDLVLGEAVGPLVDLDQPIDFAVAVAGIGLGMRDRTAVSVALKDVDQAKATLSDRFKLVPAPNGVLLVQGLGRAAHGKDDDDRGDDDRRACELAPAFGAAPVRLVCGWNAKALAELAPWLTRTLTRSPAVDDLRVDVRMQGLRGSFPKDRRMLVMLLTSGLGERAGVAGNLVASFAKEFVDFAFDLDTISLVVTMSEPVARAALNFKLSGHASSLARVITVYPAKGLATPAAFWDLPGDADIAFFEPGIDDILLAQWRDLVLRAVGEELTGVGVREADRKAIVEALGKLMPLAAMSYASGLDPEAVRKALAAEKALGDTAPPSQRAEAKRASVEALSGWEVIEVDQPAALWTGALKDLAAAWERSGLAHPMGARHRELPAMHAAPLPHGVALPAGTQHYVLELHSLDPPLAAGAAGGPIATIATKASRPLSMHLFVAPDRTRTWVALGANEVVAASKLAAAMGGVGDKLAAHPELVGLKDPVVLGGFVTLRGLVESSEQGALLSEGSTQAAADAFGELASLPHKGMVPALFYWGVDQGKAPPLTAGVAVPVGAGVVVSRAAIEDVVMTIVRHGGF